MWDVVQGYVKDRAVENRVDDIRNRGESNASTWDKVVGWATGTDVEGAVDTFVQEDKNAKIDDLLKAEGLTRGQLKIGENASEIDVRSKLKKYNKTQGDTDAIDRAKLLDNLPGGGAYQRRISEQRYHDSQQALLNERIDRRESENRKFEYQKLQDRKEDRRYNENLERLDMKDRRMAISGMTGGLAALAAAFAM